MKRFLLFFLFIISSCLIFGQNLIPNPSAEDFIECPEQLGGLANEGNGLDRYAPPWMSYRGTPDYFNNCFPQLGSNNPFGYQEPRTGDGYIGVIPFHQNAENYREYFGVELIEPLTIGETYTLCFYVSTAFRINNADRAVDNLGFLLMMSNYMEYTEGFGEIINHATFSTDYIVNDTTNWVQITSSFTADSAYQFIAFGNYYDDNNTSVELLIPEGIAWVSYYYFDDFSLNLGEDCGEVNSLRDHYNKNEIVLYPNPTSSSINIESSSSILSFQIFNPEGQLLMDNPDVYQDYIQINLKLEPGIYIAQIKTDKGYITKRFMVQF